MLKFLNNATTADVLALEWMALSAEGQTATVERDADGVPVAWRLLPFGEVSISRAGQTMSGCFSAEHAASIVREFVKKGNAIPIDCEHFSHALAQLVSRESGVPIEESDISALLKGENAAAGFGHLEQRQDGLWISKVNFVPRAKVLVKEGMYKWFSPVFRGISGATPLRITSLALTNTPAIDQLDSLAASAEDAHTKPTPQGGKENSMDLTKLRSILKLAATASEEEIMAAIEVLVGASSDAVACSEISSLLGIDAKTGPESIKGLIKSLKEKNAGDTAELSTLKTRLVTLETEQAAARRQSIIDEGVKQGKITPALLDWAGKQDSAVLSEFLRHAPVIVPGAGGIGLNADAIAMSAEDEAACQLLGIEKAKFMESKKAIVSGK